MNIKLVIFWIALFVANCESACSNFCPTKPTLRDTFFVTLGNYAGNDRFGSFYQKTFYYPRYVKATWIEAKQICSAYNLEFASLETLDEINAVIAMLKKEPSSYNVDTTIYLDGITPTPKSPTDWYFTETGDKISYAIPWWTGEPNNNGNNEHLLSLRFFRDGNVGFNDVPPKGTSLWYLCQKRI